MADELDPFTKVYTGLWALAERSQSFKDKVKLGNRIRFDDPKDRDPAKTSNASAGDLPEVTLLTDGSPTGNIHKSSSHTFVQRQYSWVINTGDFRLGHLAYPVEFALFAAMTGWYETLTALTWNEKAFVKNANLVSMTEGQSDASRNRGIKGWSSIWSVNVEMHFLTKDLRDTLGA